MSKVEDEKQVAVHELKSKIDANNATLKQVRAYLEFQIYMFAFNITLEGVVNMMKRQPRT
jgi:hypothetical protein